MKFFEWGKNANVELVPYASHILIRQTSRKFIGKCVDIGLRGGQP
jgi:hypothetical protein